MTFHAAQEHRLQDESERSRLKHGRPRGIRKLLAGIASVAVVASSLVVVGGTLGASPAAAAEPFLCAPDAVFVQSASEVRQFTVNTAGGAPGDGGNLGGINFGTNHSNNGLGISAGGRFAYTVTNAAGGKTLAKHDRVTDQTERTSFTLNAAVLRGAVHPITGVYYFAGSTSNNTINLYAWNESVSPQTYVQVGSLRPTDGSSGFGANGDMAFTASGQLVLVADRYLYAADIPTELSSSTSTIPAKQVHDMGAGVEGNGIAFGNLGRIFVSASGGGNRIIEVDLARGTTVNTTSLGTFSPTDMSSCTYPNTLTLKKILPAGRLAPTDQFGLRVGSPAGYQVPTTTVTTTGDADGIQPDYAGPIFTSQGDTFSLSESAAGTTDLDRYAASLSCVQLNTDGSTTPVPVSASNEVTQPRGQLGTEVECSFVNAALDPALDLRKISDPANGTPVAAGQTITYTVEAENTGNTVLDPVVIADDLSGVLAHAEYQDDVTTSIDGTEITSGSATITGEDLAWTGILEPGQIVTITYSVIVDDDVEGENLRNSVTASGTPPGPLDAVTPPAVTTEHPVGGFVLTKTADPVPGTAVEPGQTIRYTVTGSNTGSGSLDPVSITDDLTDVLAHAEYNDDITTEIDGTAIPAGASVSDDQLTWTGALRPGETVTITYSVTVGQDASGEVLRNTAAGSATPTAPNPVDPTGPQLPGTPIQPPAVATEHPVIGSGFTIRKSADPASGTAVEAGDTIAYTITGTNTGDTVLDPARIVDDLSAVLADARYNDDVAASSGSASVSDETLTWTGSLGRGQSVTITYTVTVDEGTTNALLRNVATGEATPRIPTDPSDPEGPTRPGTAITPPPSETTHPVVDNGFAVDKSANPATGTAVRAGDTIEYTVTAANTGNTVLDPASITDDLTDLLANAQYNGDVAASTGTATVDGATLSWTGTLAPGDRVTITYSVTIGDGVSGVLLRNTAVGSAIPLIPADPTDPTSPTTPGEPVTPPAATTEHPVVSPGFTVTKSADPASGTAVRAGDTIEYTVVGRNTGDTDLDPARIADDLTAVLSHAEYNGDVAADRGTADIADGTLTWTGSIPQGESVTITYSVTVDEDAMSALLRNVATGEATPQIPEDPTDPASATNPGMPITPPAAQTTHPVVDADLEISKSSDPASGTAVGPGDTIAFTVTARNTGNTVLDPTVVTDDLSAVLTSARYNGDVAASVGVASVDGDRLTWQGPLAPGDDVVITYTVTVNTDATGVLLRNTATGEATPLIPEDPTDPGSPTHPGQPVTPPPATTQHPVVDPGFEITKSAGPATGARVDPGSVIEYTVTGKNTGDTVLDPARISDTLADVLAHAEYNDDLAATRGAAELTGTALTWTGVLRPGEDVVITYSVTVNADAGGQTLRNSATGEATPLLPADPRDPDSPTTPAAPLTAPTVVTEHRVNEPGFTFGKSVDPAAGTAVDPGQVLTYTLTGTNTGETTLPTVDIVDDLSGVLGHAVYNGDAVAMIDGVPADATPAIASDELTWTGALSAGQTITITYSVTAGAEAAGEVLRNSATGIATPPGGEQLTPPAVTTENPVNRPGFSVSKSADPAAGAAVDPGSVITYTVTGVNTGQTALDPVVITDDLSEVLVHAGYNGDAVATVDGITVAAPSVSGDQLTWTGSLQVGTTVTITYSVTVDGEAGGQTLENSASGSATPPGGVPPIETPHATTQHAVNEPRFEMAKSADPASGTQVDPGRVVTYTVTGANTGETSLESVTITDDLADVLAHASYNGDAVATVDGSAVAAPEVADGKLVWAGALNQGERVTITYTVTVDGDAGGETLVNTASGVAVPPGGAQLTPPPSTTENPIGAPGFAFEKTSDPGSGTMIATGDVLTYTLTGVNTGETGLDEVVITDDLSGVLPAARYNGDVVAMVGGREIEAPVLDGTRLAWSGSLAEGQTVTITYSVTVDEAAAGATLRNVAVAHATAPGGERITPEASATEHLVQPSLATTGGQVLPWVVLLGMALLAGGAALTLVRRRRHGNAVT